ncbi:DNA-binding transcriptional regulator, XRE-family HTH domain [Aneurinibacillus thermoaerophilus]|uniref:DNA-binding transcriptional regulator, XRE-family HTH domain n=1 Tax=Aneurinibacillus thermoaerophilus TaxID=143495 RepID=A0A1G8FPM7_ANETH|nr:helix-turn-helix transcriptional regulator [Aneurinibacillus thermoaerophilus]SDH84085.1 DNA-binding transcriptional regulator, XRE-family HTH domain [Aneurinibacillus thermoaerophilus]
MKVHEMIRKIRKSKGITQIHVAEKLDMPVQTYNSYELGRRRITVELLREIASVLNEPIENFFEEKIYETKKLKTNSA